MKIKWSSNYERALQKLDKNMRLKVKKKPKLFIENKKHTSLRFKKVQALNHERPLCGKSLLIWI